jgi:hypothetical protein
MYRLGYNAIVTFGCLPSHYASSLSRPPQRRTDARSPLRGSSDVFAGGPISESLVPDFLRHRFDRGTVQRCSDFVTDMDWQADLPKVHETISCSEPHALA